MERDLFGKYGTTPPTLDGMSAQDVRDAQTARIEAAWHAACQMGRCAYASLSAELSQPPAVDSTTHCGGWCGSRYEGPTGPTWRYRRCQRHLAWIERRNALVRATMGKRARKGADEEVPF